MVFSYNGFTFGLDDDDVLNPEDYIPAGQYNPHNVRPWLIYSVDSVLAVVFADCVQDAVDCAADGGKLDGYRVPESEVPDHDEGDGSITRLGSASEAFDARYIEVMELPNPPFSFCALLKAAQVVPCGTGGEQ